MHDCGLLHWSVRVQEGIAVTLSVLSVWVIDHGEVSRGYMEWLNRDDEFGKHVREDAVLDKDEKKTNKITDYVKKHVDG